MQTLFSRGVGTQDADGRWVQHAEFKDSELGAIPVGWTVVPLGELIEKLMDFRGRTPKKLGMNWGDGVIPALSANNVRMGYIDFERECYLGSEELYAAWMVQGDTRKNDLVFTMDAPLGNVALIPDDRKYILSQRVVLLRANQRIKHSYMFQYLRATPSGKFLMQIRRARLPKEFSRSDLCNFRLSFHLQMNRYVSPTYWEPSTAS
jgi:type I restriction enzyme S subunit